MPISKDSGDSDDIRRRKYIDSDNGAERARGELRGSRRITFRVDGRRLEGRRADGETEARFVIARDDRSR